VKYIRSFSRFQQYFHSKFPGAGVFHISQDVVLAAFVGIVQGLLCAGTAVFLHQLVKQAGKSD
jgi:hypothetical protein